MPILMQHVMCHSNALMSCCWERSTDMRPDSIEIGGYSERTAPADASGSKHRSALPFTRTYSHLTTLSTWAAPTVALLLVTGRSFTRDISAQCMRRDAQKSLARRGRCIDESPICFYADFSVHRSTSCVATSTVVSSLKSRDFFLTEVMEH